MRTATASQAAQQPALYMAFELGERNWKIGFTIGFGQEARLRTIPSRDVDTLVAEIEAARKRFRLAVDAAIRSCYEAGREGFWLHRWLEVAGIANVVVDSSSIEVSRRRRRAKSDRLDAGSLLRLLQRYHGGEKRVWSVLRVPSPEDEDRRHLHRELMDMKGERTRLTNRIHGLLASQGISLALDAEFVARIEDLRIWDGSPLSPELQDRLRRTFEQVNTLGARINALHTSQRQQIATGTDPVLDKIRQLTALRGIGARSAWLFTMEFFAWRQFRNRREVGALAGLTPTPYQSGDANKELGISKAGNRRVRMMAVEIAWSWIRRQPQSELTRWYEARFAHGSSRMRRIGIVAVARKLLIELWRYLETGTPPAGAQLKAQ